MHRGLVAEWSVMRERTAEQTAEEQKILAEIEETGISVVHMAEDAAGPCYSHSVGMWHSFEQPEVLLIGLEPKMAQALIDLVADEAAEGREFAAGTQCDDLLQGYPARICAVPRQCLPRYFERAMWAYQDGDFPAVQLVYPDKQGRWPWDPNVRDGFRDNQPVLEREIEPGEGP